MNDTLKDILSYLDSVKDSKGFVFDSNKLIAAAIKKSIRSVQYSLKKLVLLNYISIDTIKYTRIIKVLRS